MLICSYGYWLILYMHLRVDDFAYQIERNTLRLISLYCNLGIGLEIILCVIYRGIVVDAPGGLACKERT